MAVTWQSAEPKARGPAAIQHDGRRGGGLEPLVPLLLAIGVIGGLGLVLATTSIGSGDYGQWLMTARQYLDLGVPAYRADNAVPPVMPMALALVLQLVGEGMTAVRAFAVLTVGFLGASAYLAAAILFRSRRAGLLAVLIGLVLIDQFLELFAFGGLLQAGAIAFAWLTMAAFVRAGREPGPAWRWWSAGAICLGLAALTHMGTAYILIPAGGAAAMLSASRAESGSRARLARLAPLGAVLGVVAVIWLFVLLPGGTDLIRNPASLAYRGPNRLVESLTESWVTALVVVGGLAAIGVGAVREWQHRRAGPWAVLAAWTLITLAWIALAVVSRAATDYPRFATPLLAPLVVGLAGAAAVATGLAGRALVRRTQRGTAGGWATTVVVIAMLASIPLAVGHFRSEANGYRLRDPATLLTATSWIEANLGPEATVLAPVREAKWIEGITGRPALFSNAFRYSFRADEWQRSLAADAILRSSGALVNQYFFVRTVAGGSDPSAARDLVIGANHGGEYLDLLRLVPASTRILAPDSAQPTLATLTNLAPAGREVTGTPSELTLASAWTGERRGASVGYRQTVTLHQDASVLDLGLAASTSLPVAGLEVELRPPGGVVTDHVVINGPEATLTFRPMGASAPSLRVVLAGAGTLEATTTGGILVRSPDSEVRLLVTDLTAEAGNGIRLQWLDPRDLVDRYGVQAVLLARDPALEARGPRIEALGFHLARDFGSYLVLVPNP